VEVDDSAGRPLATTPPGAFLRLLAEALADALAPVPLLALLKHPLAAGGMDPAAFRRNARRLDRLVLRGPRPGPGLEGLRAAIREAKAPRHGESAERTARRAAGLDEIDAWVAGWGGQLARLDALIESKAADLPALVAAHVAAAEALAATDAAPGTARLWAGEAGEAAAVLVADLVAAGDALGAMPGRAYPALLDALMAGVAVRARHGAHPRLSVWGPLEARLQQADLVILGGLNEGTWPPGQRADPWLSRPMRSTFGLMPPERRVGLSAHDFAQAAAAPRVVLSRATKVDGTPTVPSRWLLRLFAVLGDRRPAASPAVDWARALDPPSGTPAPPPEPRPPLEARPRELSVSDVERWMRDPYALYARKILRLDPLDPLDADPGAAERGSVIHDALYRFLQAQGDRPLGSDALDRLLAIGREAFGAALLRPAVWAFWWPRFEAVARWFVAVQAERHDQGFHTAGLEVSGRLTIHAPGGGFAVRARADRIDRTRDGALVILDYKTGGPPSDKTVHAGFAPQLPLEGAIARAGGFDGVAPASLAELAFWRLSGGSPAGEMKLVSGAADATAAKALEGLARLVAQFDDPNTPYRSRPRPKFVLHGDYDHLARVAEWARDAGDDE
jgi:ATP-dependent helicase/nuclease subunit B